MTTHPKGRLNRQELGWLLTQEAQGAAERLRKGVQVLLTNIPGPTPVAADAAPVAQVLDDSVDKTLDALDDAMRMLSSIHQKPVVARGRRGRIDLASLLWEVSPEARVSLEPGSGTEVFGDEAELRRMLHVLVGPGSRAGSAVTLKRDGDEVRLSVALGPDSSVTSETERAWLARMAIRYGGRYDLEGGMEVLALPADAPEDRQERDALRKELDEARKQGEAYARELAALFHGGEESHGPPPLTPSSFPPAMAAPGAERMSVLVRVSGAIAAELRGMLSPVGWDLLALRGDSRDGVGERLEAIQRRLMGVQDFVAELAAIGELDPTEGTQEVDLVELVRVVARSAEARAHRAGVELRVETVPDAPDARATTRGAPRALVALLRELVSHALTATPKGKRVVVTVASPPTEASGFGSRVVVDDGGATIPAAARRGFLGLELEPGTYGRPSSLALYVAQALASAQGATFALDDAPGGGLRVAMTFTR